MTYKDIKEINSEDIEFISFAYSLINSAKFPSFQKVTETYNKVFGTRLNNTSCSQCIRQRVLELKSAIDKFEEILKEKENDKVNDDKVATDKKDEKQDDKVNDETKSRRGRKKQGSAS